MSPNVQQLKTLVMMQLKDKLDLSFVRSFRATIIKVVLSVLKFAIAVALFFLLFFLCKLLSLFYSQQAVPDNALGFLFTLILLMSIVTCTVGLTQTLYMAADNKVLLTFPVKPTMVYLSKLVLYYIFELKKNVSFTLPLFVAYGIVNNAVWYYYLWLVPCFVLVSLVPVAIGALISIPSLFVWQFVKKFRWLQGVLTFIGASLVSWLVVWLIGRIPSNIDILGQWYAMTLVLQDFLEAFAKFTAPFYYLTLMIVGGTHRISARLVQWDTLMYFSVTLASIVAMVALSFLVVRPLFVWMASRQFEYETRKVQAQPNVTHNKRLSPFFESMKMDLRSSSFIITAFVQLVLPAIATLFLNRLYAAMNTNYSGQLMTKAFNLLVMLVITLAFNNTYATVYSKEGAARNILKTRPQQPIYTLFGRIVFRAAVLALSCIGIVLAYTLAQAFKNVEGTVVFQALSFDYVREILLMGAITLLVGEAHLLWSAEMDIMHNYAEQYQTVGLQFDSPNERNATIIGFLLSALFTGMYYLFSDRGTFSALVKGLCVAVALLAARIYLFVTRSKLYFVEN